MSDQTEAYIDLYLKGYLSEEENAAFEDRMQQEPELAAQVKQQKVLIGGIVQHHRNRLKAMFAEEEEAIKQESKQEEEEARVVTFPSPKWAIGIAAALALLLIVFFQLRTPSVDPQEVYQEFAEHYDSGFGERNAEDSCSQFMEGIQLYNLRQYHKAIAPLQKLIQQESEMALCGASIIDMRRLLGISQLFADQPEDALATLSSQIEISETSRWYYTLALVKMGNIKEARSVLNAWTSPSDYYQIKIRALLESLE